MMCKRSLTYLLSVLKIRILLAGDVERNPGPLNVNNMKIYHLNVRSLVNKVDEITVEAQDFDIVGFTETHLDDTIPNDDINMPDFRTPIRRDRNRHGGGIAVYVKNSICVKRRQDLESNLFETICIEILNQPDKIVCTFIYKPPNEQVFR